MGFRFWYKDPDGEITEIVDMVRLGDAELVSNAEEGSVGTGTVMLNDPTGSFMLRGHRLFMVTEDEAAGDDFGGVVWFGYTAGRTVSRNTNAPVGPGRDISVEVVDINTLLYDRLLHGGGNNRPEETEIDRVKWLLGQSEVGRVLNDYTFVEGTEGSNLDARDCNGDTPYDVLDDAAQQSGRNYFLLWQASGASTPDVYLWYRHGTGSAWPALVSISNFPDEWDDPLRTTPAVLAPSRDAELVRDPSRVFSNIRGEYDGGFVLESKASTAERFRVRWTDGQWERVKSAAKARHRAQRTLNDIDTELDEITVAVLVPRAQVNSAMAGQKIPVHFQHLPGYSDDYVEMRIKARTVREVSIDLVELALTLTGDSPSTGDADTSDGEPGAAFAVLDYAHGLYPGNLIRFGGSGDNPPSGWISQPTVGLLSIVNDAVMPRPYVGIQVDGTGTVDASFFCSYTGVLTHDATYTVTLAITLNGAEVAAASKNYFHEGNPTGIVGNDFVSVAGLAVAPGDVIAARVTVGPVAIAFFKVPAGVGVGGEQLKVFNGSLS